MECSNLEEVRNCINKIDEQIVKLICKRQNYILQASKFKKDSSDVKAPARVEAVIEKVRRIAEENTGNPEIVEKLYREMIAGFIHLELEEFKKGQN